MLRVGSVGFGGIAQGPQVGAWKKIANVSVVAVCDINPEKLEKYSENSRKMAITDANERIYSVVKKVLGLV